MRALVQRRSRPPPAGPRRSRCGGRPAAGCLDDELKRTRGHRVGRAAVRREPLGVLVGQQLIAAVVGDRPRQFEGGEVPALRAASSVALAHGLLGKEEIDVDASASRYPEERSR